MTITRNDDEAMTRAAVERALAIHRSIAACHAHIARGDSVHAFTAALVLPCYQAEFLGLARLLDPAQQSELRTALQALREPV
ncbi:hypothetical protein [Variovorax sp. 770b2]|jgi:hypothetical protein|uniref:hypothetical protein n=1 Tax=Variovorax sp. 770b2 TaxID=1566271 RepID=UPI0008E33A9C|nr:hypothetical protein [Variovorax sp. 770b2]SFQ24141.1 hypothetical protein SAMN03159339_6208 [Variovorax sp. 770b2]